MIDRIIVSSDVNKMYLNFWPSISTFWKSLNYKITLGLIMTDNDNKEIIKECEKYGDVIVFTMNPKYNKVIQSKLCRWYISKFYLNEIICIQDIDYYVFDKHEHIECELKKLNMNTDIFTYAFNAYDYIDKYNNIGLYRFPATPTISKGINIYNMFECDINLSFDDFLNEINKIIELNNLSDEYIIMNYLGIKNNMNIIKQIKYIPREDFPKNGGRATRRLDRTDNNPNSNYFMVLCFCGKKKCEHSIEYNCTNGWLIDMQPSRPYDEKLYKIMDILNVPKDIQNIRIIENFN